jgi:hypothetical protein
MNDQVHEKWEGNTVRFSAARMEATAKRLRELEEECLWKWTKCWTTDEAHQVVGVIAEVGLVAYLVLDNGWTVQAWSRKRYELFDTKEEVETHE